MDRLPILARGLVVSENSDCLLVTPEQDAVYLGEKKRPLNKTLIWNYN